MTEYICSICNRKCIHKSFYDEHVLMCEFWYKPKKEINKDIDQFDEKTPTQKEMYQLLKHMMVRIDKLEKENKQLKQIQKQKLQILEWLNNTPQNTLNITFKFWLKTEVIPIVHNYLEDVFTNDLITGMKNVFEKTTINTNTIPIRCFTNKPNIIYINQIATPNDPPKWKQISPEEMNVYLSAVSHQFLVEFNNRWCVEYAEQIENNEEYKQKYHVYYSKILGKDDDVRNKRLREYLFKMLKQDIKTIVEFQIN